MMPALDGKNDTSVIHLHVIPLPLFLLLLGLGTLGASLLWDQRRKRSYARFFDPAIVAADDALAHFAQRVGGTHTPSVKRWRDLVLPWWGFRFTGRYAGFSSKAGGRSAVAFPGDGMARFQRHGFPVEVSWIVVGLNGGLALLPRVHVHLPPGITLSGLQRKPGFLLGNPFELWARDVYLVADHGPRVHLALSERQAFDALASRCAWVCLLSSTPAHPLTGRLPDPYALYIEIWGAPLHGMQSSQPTEGNVFSWSDDFRPDDLEALVALSVQLAKTAGVSRA